MPDVEHALTRVVALRFFGGMSVEETAEVLGISVMTVMRDWGLARAFRGDANWRFLEPAKMEAQTCGFETWLEALKNN